MITVSRFVEVVRHAAGETPDRFHLLRLQEPLLRLVERRLGALALGHVLLHRHVVGDAAVAVDERRDRGLDPHEVAVLLAVDQLASPLAAGGDRAPEVAVGLGRRLARLQEPRVPADRLLRGVARALGEARVDVLDRAVGIGDDDRRGALLDGARELAGPLLALAQPVEGGAMLGDEAPQAAVGLQLGERRGGLDVHLTRMRGRSPPSHTRQDGTARLPFRVGGAHMLRRPAWRPRSAPMRARLPACGNLPPIARAVPWRRQPSPSSTTTRPEAKTS